MELTKKIISWLLNYSEDLILLTGFVLISIGAYKLLPNLVWFVSGLECIIFAYIIGRGK